MRKLGILHAIAQCKRQHPAILLLTQRLSSLVPEHLWLGWLGKAHRLSVDCILEGVPCRVLVDMGSTIYLVRPSTLPSTDKSRPLGWPVTHVVDVSRAQLCLGAETVALHTTVGAINQSGCPYLNTSPKSVEAAH